MTIAAKSNDPPVRVSLWAQRFSLFRFLTWFGLTFMAFGQALFGKALGISPHFVEPLSWDSSGLKKAAWLSLKNSSDKELEQLWLLIPGIVLIVFGTFFLIPSIIAFTMWFVCAHRASTIAGRSKQCPWPIAILTMFIPVVQLFAPPILISQLVNKGDKARRLVLIWWAFFLLTVFPVFTGGGALPGFGSLIFIIVYLVIYSVACIFTIRSTIRMMNAINRLKTERV